MNIFKAALVVTAAIVLTVTAACAATESGSSSSRRPGSPDVYAKISGETSCTSLHATADRYYDDWKRYEKNPRTIQGFDMEDVTRNYMLAALNRMDDIGCPD